MAIAHSVTDTDIAASANTTTIASFTVTGTDPVLIAKVAVKDTTMTVASVIWNSTENFTEETNDRNGNAFSSIWYLASPTATTSAIVITLSTGTARHVSAVSLYTGVDDASPVRSAATTTGNGTDAAPTTDVVALNGEMVVDSLCQVSAGPDTATGDHTERHDTAAVGGGTDTRGASQEKASTGATETMGWTMSDPDNWAVCAMALREPFTPSGNSAYYLAQQQRVIS